jgi:hypothetical protein
MYEQKKNSKKGHKLSTFGKMIRWELESEATNGHLNPPPPSSAVSPTEASKCGKFLKQEATDIYREREGAREREGGRRRWNRVRTSGAASNHEEP